ncbi:hypothetical protein CNY89_02840 [Amaricoccus sp. HAR-UPW-R2A-40]|nr:hypothetical protein CNY89_02840 [Amaricoccus sp. HAR-UPW-R2A-40]
MTIHPALPSEPGGRRDFDPAELGALAHLYRGEVYRSTIWRTRLDQTTNWAVVTTGLALSLTFAGPYASPLPLILVGLLVVVFLLFEARRYRYFNVWRARCRLMERDLYGPLLRGQGVHMDGRWNTLLAQDYVTPRFHISQIRSIGRRLRKNYRGCPAGERHRHDPGAAHHRAHQCPGRHRFALHHRPGRRLQRRGALHLPKQLQQGLDLRPNPQRGPYPAGDLPGYLCDEFAQRRIRRAGDHRDGNGRVRLPRHGRRDHRRRGWPRPIWRARHRPLVHQGPQRLHGSPLPRVPRR